MLVWLSTLRQLKHYQVKIVAVLLVSMNTVPQADKSMQLCLSYFPSMKIVPSGSLGRF